MKYGIIGGGNVGLTFAYFLYKSEKSLLIFTHSIKDKSRYFRHIPEKYFTNDFRKFVYLCDTIFVATPDHAIEYTINSVFNITKNKKIVVFSGSFLSKRKNIFNLHPAASIPKPVFRKNFLKKIVFTSFNLPESDDILSDLNIKVVHIGKYSPLYHVGAMLASNFITILLFAAENILKTFTKNKKDTMLLLKSLSITGLNAYFNTHKMSGPISRGDMATINKHKLVLKGRKEGIIYRALIKYGADYLYGKK